MKKFEVHCEWKYEAVIVVESSQTFPVKTVEDAIKEVEGCDSFPDSGEPVQESFKVTAAWEKAE